MTTSVQIKGTYLRGSPFAFTQVLEKGAPSYRATVVLDPDNDFQAIQNAMMEAATAKFPNGIPPNLALPWMPADDKGFPGQWLLNAKERQEEYKPGIYAPWADPADPSKPAPLTDARSLFPGCKIILLVNFFGYSNLNNGVGVGFVGLQVIDNRPELRIAGDARADASTAFTPVPGAPAPLAPTAYSQPQPGTPGNPTTPATGYAAPGAPQVPAAPPGQPAAAAPAAGYPSSVPPGAPTHSAPAQGYAAPPGQPAAATPAAGYPSSVPPGAPGGYPYNNQ